MHDLWPTIQEFLLTHKAWVGPIYGLLAFGESLIFVGLFIPATAIMLGTGGLIQKDILDPWTVIIWSIAGAILGDAVTYWIGRAVGRSAVRHWPLNRDPSAVAKARLFFRKYGFLSIFIGRFLGPVRSTIPLIAGMARMRHLTFQIANTTSAAVFVPVYLLPGYFFGKLFIKDVDNIGFWEVVGVVGFILALTMFFTWLGIRMQRRRGKERRASGQVAPNHTQV